MGSTSPIKEAESGDNGDKGGSSSSWDPTTNIWLDGQTRNSTGPQIDWFVISIQVWKKHMETFDFPPKTKIFASYFAILFQDQSL